MQTAEAAVTKKAAWLSLAALPSEELWRGTVFRITSAAWPYEETVDLMCTVCLDAPCGLSLVVCTGYKAGLTLIQLPEEAAFRGNARSLSVSWLKSNWNKWIYQECSIEQVLVIPHYPGNVCIEHGEAGASRDLKV